MDTNVQCVQLYQLVFRAGWGKLIALTRGFPVPVDTVLVRQSTSDMNMVTHSLWTETVCALGAKEDGASWVESKEE